MPEMPEYIEREAALHVIMPVYEREKIKKIPAANVELVRHGRWKYYNKQGIAVCTACSFERKLDDDFGAAICCPNCGAKMDLTEAE